MNKITKSQFIEYDRMSSAVNLFMRLIADLQAYSQLLQRIGAFDKLDELNELLVQFKSAIHVKFLETLEDDVEK